MVLYIVTLLISLTPQWLQNCEAVELSYVDVMAGRKYENVNCTILNTILLPIIIPETIWIKKTVVFIIVEYMLKWKPDTFIKFDQSAVTLEPETVVHLIWLLF